MTVISDIFRRLIQRIAPTDREHAAYLLHAREVERALAGRVALHSVRPIGSQVRGTAVRGDSDRDLLAVFHRSEAAYGDRYVGTDTLLKRVRQAISARFARTSVGRDGQAIVVSFADGSSIDVVPSIFWEMREIAGRRTPVYLIPDGAGGWLETAPDAHAAHIDKAYVSSGGKFANCAKLLKVWRLCREPRVPLSSFHLELLFADAGTFSIVATYQECLVAAFTLLARRGCAAIRDPLGVSGYVPATRTPAQREQAHRAVCHAAEKAARALAFEQRERYVDAVAAGISSSTGASEFTVIGDMNSPSQRHDPIEGRYFVAVETAEACADLAFWLGVALTAATIFVEAKDHPLAAQWIHILLVIAVLVGFVIGAVVRLRLAPKAESQRQRDLLSQAFDSALTHERTTGYYNNAETQPHRKMAANVFENAHFTREIARRMVKWERVKAGVLVIAFALLVLNRSSELSWISTAAAALFSEQVLSRWIRLEWLQVHASKAYDDAFTLFQNRPKSSDFAAGATALFVRYECVKAIAGVTLSSRVFRALNTSLSAEWETVKSALGI